MMHFGVFAILTNIPIQTGFRTSRWQNASYEMLLQKKGYLQADTSYGQ